VSLRMFVHEMATPDREPQLQIPYPVSVQTALLVMTVRQF